MVIKKYKWLCKTCDVKCGSLSNDIQKFSQKIEEINKKRVEEIAGVLNINLPKQLEAINLNPDWLIIVTTGSDGRLENLPCGSGIELIVYKSPDLKIPNNLEEVLKSIIWYQIIDFNKKTLHHIAWISPKLLIEVKTIRDGMSLLFHGDDLNDKSQFFPTRFLDSKVLFGSWVKYKDLWNLIIQYIRTDKKGFKDLLENFKSRRIRYHKKISENGRGRFRWEKIFHFNLDKWELYYYKDESKEIGVKMWPLRYYQYKLAYLIYKFILLANELSKEDIDELINLNKNIKTKIEYLRDKVEWLPKAEWELKDFINIYYKFLYFHLLLQRSFKNNKAKNKIIFQLDYNDKQELLEQLDFSNKILKDLKIKRNV